jgi:hypothetical protein
MSESTPATGTEPASTEPSEPAPQTETVDLAAEVEKWKTLARKQEERAKSNASAAKELAELKGSMMSEQEKAIAAAVDAARSETLGQVGSKLVAAEIKAAAAGRLQPEQLDVLIGNIDARKFLGDDGSVLGDAVKSFVDGFAPQPQPSAPATFDLGQGARAANGGPALGSSGPAQDFAKFINGQLNR